MGGAVVSFWGGVDFGDLDVTFSAPFYTGVFLSSRELQGTYELHQNIVIEGMERRLQWEWNPPSDVPEFWNRTVSPPYFIGTEIDDSSSGLIKAISNLIRFSSMCKDYWFEYDTDKIHVSVKFFEFGFGSVSIRLRGVSCSKIAVSSAKDLKEFLASCEKAIRPILNFAAGQVTRGYRKSVPCCIKNSDIWDINNFAGLEASENMCRTGKVQEISIVGTIEKQKDFNKIKSELEKTFLYFSEDLHTYPNNFTYRLFSNKENITIALCRRMDDNELSDLFYVTEMIGVYLAVGKYFYNFIYSYFNYVSSEYEIIASKSIYRFGNIKKLRNLIEKFSDIETFYEQLFFQMQQQNSYNINLYKLGLLRFSPQFVSTEKFWEKLNRAYIKLKDKHETINKVTSQSSFSASLSVSYIVTFLTAFTLIMYIRLYPNLIISNFSNIIFVIFIVLIIFVFLGIYDFGIMSNRKLYFINWEKRRKYKDQFKKAEDKNMYMINCICDIDRCHRCQGNEWHNRIFYCEDNLCFRCGEIHTV